MTHWEVSDQVAALLVVLTINDMKEKPSHGVTGALREAQLQIARPRRERQAAGGDRPSVLLGAVRGDRRRRRGHRPGHCFIKPVEGFMIRSATPDFRAGRDDDVPGHGQRQRVDMT